VVSGSDATLFFNRIFVIFGDADVSKILYYPGYVVVFMSVLTLDSTLLLPVSGRYTNPQNENDILPIVYGEMTGAWVAPCIDTTTFIYCIASHEVQSAVNGNTLTVYDDTGTRTDATFYSSLNYESQGTIAAVQLLSTATGNLIVSCNGKPDSSGVLITNPVDTVVDLIGNTDTTLDQTTIAQARRDATAEGYKAAGVILKEQPYIFWLTAIMGSFLGDWWVSNDGLFKLRFDISAIGSLQVAGFLVERRATSVSGALTLKNVVNQAILNYQLSYTDQDKRYKEGVQSDYLGYDDGESSKDTTSQNKFGIRKRTFPLDWVQETAVATIVQSAIIDRFKDKTYIINWTEYGFLNIHVEEGDYVTYSWEERIDDNGNALVNQISQVLSKDIDLDSEQITFILKDLGEKLSGEPVTWNGTVNTGDGGRFSGEDDTRRLV
jgi:hypothetical protein